MKDKTIKIYDSTLRDGAQTKGVSFSIDDKLRILENNKEFNEEFIDLARSVYKSNDERFAIKNEINKTFDSEIQEQKEYENYS